MPRKPASVVQSMATTATNITPVATISSTTVNPLSSLAGPRARARRTRVMPGESTCALVRLSREAHLLVLLEHLFALAEGEALVAEEEAAAGALQGDDLE